MTDEMQALCFFAGANSILGGTEFMQTSGAIAPRDREPIFNAVGRVTCPP